MRILQVEEINFVGGSAINDPAACSTAITNAGNTGMAIGGYIGGAVTDSTAGTALGAGIGYLAGTSYAMSNSYACQPTWQTSSYVDEGNMCAPMPQ